MLVFNTILIQEMSMVKQTGFKAITENNKI